MAERRTMPAAWERAEGAWPGSWEGSRALALSVVIPTRNRPQQLLQTLSALAEQADVRFEVLVVDDGSRDSPQDEPGQPTRSALGSLPATPYPLLALYQQARGPAAARNRGVAHARASRVLFLGDDTRPSPGCLARHLVDHDQTEHGIQGHIDWDPEQPITALMDFLAPAGPQFYFHGLRDQQLLSYSAVLGSNLSAPRHWLETEAFDETFPHAALEDTELAYRWQRRGWRVRYRPDALCWHHHHYGELTPFLARQQRAGRSARHAISRHPRLAFKLLLQPLLQVPLFLLRARLRRRRGDVWCLACTRAYLAGLLRSGRS